MGGARLRTKWERSILTVREMDVWRQVARGRSNDQVALDLHISAQTVKFNLTKIYRKLEVANRTELALLWWRQYGSWTCCDQSIYTPFCPWCGASQPRPPLDGAAASPS